MTGVSKRREAAQARLEKQQKKKRVQELAKEWQMELLAIRQTKEELEHMYMILEDTIDEKLIDSIIYQIKAIEARYDFHYINLRQLEARWKTEEKESCPTAAICPGIVEEERAG